MEGYLVLAEKYKQRWLEVGDDFLTSVARYSSVRKVLVEVYYELCRQKKCESIEELPAAEKHDLWNCARHLAPDEGKEFLTELCRALHGLTVFVQL